MKRLLTLLTIFIPKPETILYKQSSSLKNLFLNHKDLHSKVNSSILEKIPRFLLLLHLTSVFVFLFSTSAVTSCYVDTHS